MSLIKYNAKEAYVAAEMNREVAKEINEVLTKSVDDGKDSATVIVAGKSKKYIELMLNLLESEGFKVSTFNNSQVTSNVDEIVFCWSSAFKS